MALGRIARVLMESLFAGLAAFGIMLVVVHLFEPTRPDAIPAVLLGGMAGVVIFACVIAAFHRQAVLDRWRGIHPVGDAAS
jgi:hypothetical protein